MEMVIKIDSQAFLASLQDVVRQIQAGCTQVTWQFGMQDSEPTPVHNLTNAEDLAAPVCTADEQTHTDSKCQVAGDNSVQHSEIASLDSPSDSVGQAMIQQATTPHGSGVVKSAIATPNAVAQFDTVTRAYSAQRTAPTQLPVAPTATLTPEVLRQSGIARLEGHELVGEVAREEASQGEKSMGGDMPVGRITIPVQREKRIEPLQVPKGMSIQAEVGSSPSSGDLIVQQEATSYTLEMVRTRLAQLMRRGEGAFVRAVLACYGATKLPQVAPQNYQAIMEKVGEKDAM